ncbi:hypothetical protein GIB67_006081 [Kingdonia uniflora]|uniref:Pentatricopeptide repeat-containing protein n=1 Tax=Kingdonia uniflora TaxID=39325 RepID=A0A7J7LPU4_9MAGN|nr:hypothetical protein GIB67_006081 [Kingdonia uniflora]
MKSSSLEPNNMVLSTILSACSRFRNLNTGKAIHDYISEKNIAMNSRLQTSLITMYLNCGSVDLAKHLYDKMMPKNIIASTAMVLGQSNLRQLEDARYIFNQMAEKDLDS